MNTSTLGFAARVAQQYFFFLTSQKWDRARIHAYQDERLINIVRHAAANVPYYRNLFNKIQLDPSTFRGRQDMHKIPLLSKEILRTHQDEFVAENAAEYGINWDSTSGSTGTPLHFIVDHAAKAQKLACVLRSYQWAGHFPGRKTFSFQSYKFDDPGAFFKHYPMARLWRFDAKQLKKDSAATLLDMIARIGPSVFIGYPFSIYMLARFAREQGKPIRPLTSIVTAGETLSEQRRKLLEEAYRCKVYDFYSHHENVTIISECGHQTKHICEDFAYNEIVDETGNDSSRLGEGELIGTGFVNYAMPLIRYRTGDRVILDKDPAVCRCGRHFRKIKAIVGRQNDYIVTPDGRYLGNVLEHSVDGAKGVMLSQCVQDAVDHIYLNLIVDGSYSEDSKKALEAGLRKRLGNEIKIDYKLVAQLERRNSGKTPFIVSKIGHEYI
ncbi:MAG: phenylacetate--CoA ligase family protein [Thermodesulfobacteriota bacterium]